MHAFTISRNDSGFTGTDARFRPGISFKIVRLDVRGYLVHGFDLLRPRGKTLDIKDPWRIHWKFVPTPASS